MTDTADSIASCDANARRVGQQAAVCVRDATPQDLPVIHRMIYELADYEGMPEGPHLTIDELRSDGFECKPPWFLALVAEVDGNVVGYAIYNRAYSSWTRRALYLEDLYVEREYRRSGVGLALVRSLCVKAQREGVTRLDWHVSESNTSALAFYSRLGSRDLRLSEGRLAMRLDAPAITALAATNPLPKDLPYCIP